MPHVASQRAVPLHLVGFLSKRYLPFRLVTLAWLLFHALPNVPIPVSCHVPNPVVKAEDPVRRLERIFRAS